MSSGNLFYVLHARNNMFWEMLKVARWHAANNLQPLYMLQSWRNSRNGWFKMVLNEK